jgi:hypothetical protein
VISGHDPSLYNVPLVLMKSLGLRDGGGTYLTICAHGSACMHLSLVIPRVVVHGHHKHFHLHQDSPPITSNN